MTTISAGVHPADVRVVPDWELCDRLRRAMRLVPGLTNEEIAEFMGVARPTVSTWLHGRRTPPKSTVMLWADMTGVDRDWLITGTPSSEWYAMRDLNPQPADLEPPLTVGRPVLRLLGGRRIERPSTVKPRLTLIWSAA